MIQLNYLLPITNLQEVQFFLDKKFNINNWNFLLFQKQGARTFERFVVFW